MRGGTYVHVAARGGGVMVAMVHCVCHFGDFGSFWLVSGFGFGR